jgi:hypothetical protein
METFFSLHSVYKNNNSFSNIFSFELIQDMLINNFKYVLSTCGVVGMPTKDWL